MLYGNILIKYYLIKGHNNSSRESLLRYRESRFRKLLYYAYEHAPFYRTYYKENGITARDIGHITIEDLPWLDKEQVSKNFDALITRPGLNRQAIHHYRHCEQKNVRFNKKYLLVHSAGSTGRPAYFVYDHAALATLLVTVLKAVYGEHKFLQAVFKLRRGLRILCLTATEGCFVGVMLARMIKELPLFNVMLLNANSPNEQWVEQVLEFNPDVIFGYPSVLKVLGHLLHSKNIFLDVMNVITSGEPLTQGSREALEGVFLTNVSNIYSASESLVIGMENPEQHGIYLFDDLNYVECRQEYTLLTPLYNYVQPLIRYKLTDVLQIRERAQDESLPYTKVKKIWGRKEDVLWFLNREGVMDFIHPLVIDDLKIEGINSFQFVQYSRQYFEIKIIPENKSDTIRLQDQITWQMKRILEKKKMDNLFFRLEFVDTINIDPVTGKRQLSVIEKF